jgi:hypothetical protein
VGDLGLQQAFARYKAKLENPMWAVSAIAEDGAIVVSCWTTNFGGGDKGVLRYTDHLSRWGNNKPGNNLLREHLMLAISESLPVRLVMAKPNNPSELEGVVDASKIEKTFHIRDDVVGKVISFDGDTFIIDFVRA